jgi:nucleoside-diphosphate-sugar epimerase
MTLENKIVLVTGGTGFIGSRLVEKLAIEQRAHVRVLVRNFSRASRIARLPVEMIAGDIKDFELVRRAAQGCEVAFNCVYDFNGDHEGQRRTSSEGARNLARAILEERVGRLIHVSTFAVYAPAKDGDLTETSPWPKSNHYYVSIKRETEQLLLQMHKAKGLPVVVLQPTLVYGPFSHFWTVAMTQKLTSGIVALVNGGTGYSNPVYIDDLIDAMILAASRPDVLGETFLISGEKPITWRDFYAAFESIIGTRSCIEMSEEELRRESAKRKRQASPMARLFSLARRPDVLAILRTLPPVPTTVSLVKKVLSQDQWLSVKTRLNNGSQSSNGNDAVVRPLYLPDELTLQMYKSRTTVRIDKARSRLGYMPKFDFEAGMSLTAEFLRWANLAPGVSSKQSAVSSKR